MKLTKKVIFNVLAKDLNNAKDIVQIAGDRVLIGLLVKNYTNEKEAAKDVQLYKQAGIPVSIGLGAGDPAQWKKVADVAADTHPDHINQVFPAAGYTLGKMVSLKAAPIVNALVEPSGEVGYVYIGTGPNSAHKKEKVSCELAATMLAEIGIPSVKFYPIAGDSRLDEVAAMVKAAVEAGLEFFEPTGGITLNNVKKIVDCCLENGAKQVIPHLYTSIIDQETGETTLENIQQLLDLGYDSER